MPAAPPQLFQVKNPGEFAKPKSEHKNRFRVLLAEQENYLPENKIPKETRVANITILLWIKKPSGNGESAILKHNRRICRTFTYKVVKRKHESDNTVGMTSSRNGRLIFSCDHFIHEVRFINLHSADSIIMSSTVEFSDASTTTESKPIVVNLIQFKSSL